MDPDRKLGFYTRREYEEPQYYDYNAAPAFNSSSQYTYESSSFSSYSPSFYPGLYESYPREEYTPLPTTNLVNYAAEEFYPPGFNRSNVQQSQVFRGPNPNAVSFIPMNSPPTVAAAVCPPPAFSLASETEDENLARYGVRNILTIKKSLDEDKLALVRGNNFGNVTIGLNDNESMSSKLLSPFDGGEIDAREQPEFTLPPCYIISKPILRLKMIGLFCTNTLFYIFYNMPGEMLQALAAEELYRRDWQYHLTTSHWYLYSSQWKTFDLAKWDVVSTDPPVSDNFLTKEEVKVKRPNTA